jgi:NAD(P)H-hydrate epimerase
LLRVVLWRRIKGEGSMVPVVDNLGMRAADRHTIEELGLPSLVLMEQAAAAVNAAVEERTESTDLVVVLCGRGNNGGDGLAMARQRHASGGLVEAVLVANPGELSQDAAVQWELRVVLGYPAGCSPRKAYRRWRSF